MKNKFWRYCIRSYIAGKLRAIVVFTVFAAIFAAIFFLYRINLDAVLFAAILCAVLGAIYMIWDFTHFYRRFYALQGSLSNITITTDTLPEAANAIERSYQELIRILFESHSRLINENNAAKSYMSDYYAMWVHQIKIPISAMHMLLQEEPKSSPLNIELFKIEQYVEMALSYVRLESDYTDYVFKQYELDPIVKQAVRKYAPLFISKKISLDITDTDIKVNTDSKWLRFVIEQILSNSLKYTKQGTISIYYEKPKTLVIEDTGIGIAPEDIPRIGEKGFTGYNGRIYKKSTGLGLYLCKETLTRLSHTMEISSEVDNGTKVSINLETRHMIME